eukprot:144206-Rhodomonas_salina.2
MQLRHNPGTRERVLRQQTVWSRLSGSVRTQWHLHWSHTAFPSPSSDPLNSHNLGTREKLAEVQRGQRQRTCQFRWTRASTGSSTWRRGGVGWFRVLQWGSGTGEAAHRETASNQNHPRQNQTQQPKTYPCARGGIGQGSRQSRCPEQIRPVQFVHDTNGWPQAALGSFKSLTLMFGLPWTAALQARRSGQPALGLLVGWCRRRRRLGG